MSGIVAFLPSLLTSSFQWLWAELLSDLWNVNLSLTAADAVTGINLNSVNEKVSKDTNFSFLNHLQFFQRFSAQLSLWLEIYFSFFTLDFIVKVSTTKDTNFGFKKARMKRANYLSKGIFSISMLCVVCGMCWQGCGEIWTLTSLVRM